MEAKRRHSASSEDRNFNKKSMTAKSNESDTPKSKNVRDRDKFKNSYIPILKGEKIETASCIKIQGKSSSASKIQRIETDVKADDLEEKLKQIQEKEKSIADYYIQIEDLIQKFVKEQDEKLESKDAAWRSCAKKMISEPIFNKGQAKNILSEFEVNVHQISDIWLATTTKFSSALKNLKNNPSIHPIEVEMENVKMQLAIKQAKSLTLLKTRDVIEDVKKLLQNREVIRTELEKLLNDKNLKVKCGKCGSLKNVLDKCEEECLEKVNKMGTGDSYKEDNSEDLGTTSTEIPTDESMKQEDPKVCVKKKVVCLSAEDSSSDGREKSSADTEQDGSTPSAATSEELKEAESLAKEMNKKNETIMNLNNKIFKLQKTLNEQSLRCNELQVKLSECDEKIQWNQVLWKQIGKLKEQIKCLQHSNKQLESQKKELVCRMTRLDQEIERVTKMNELLNKKKFLLSTQEEYSGSSQEAELVRRPYKEWERCCSDEKSITDKQGAITQLQTILSIMTDQRNLAQQQICLYQSKIEELETMLQRNNPL